MSLISPKHLLANADCTWAFAKPVPTNSFQTQRITYDEIWIKNIFHPRQCIYKAKHDIFSSTYLVSLVQRHDMKELPL